MSKIILTGDRPTGRLHVGHYVGSPEFCNFTRSFKEPT